MNSQEIKDTTVSGNGSIGVEHSDSVASVSRTGGKASSTELAKALSESQKTNAAMAETISQLQLEIANLKSSANSNADVNTIITALAGALKNAGPQGPSESDNINRTTDFTNSRAAVDGRSIMEAQQTLQIFRREIKKPISIPKYMQNQIGPSLTITVNGVRVSIPCDGKTYMINKTHWEHAKERVAKLDNLNASISEPGVIEV